MENDKNTNGNLNRDEVNLERPVKKRIENFQLLVVSIISFFSLLILSRSIHRQKLKLKMKRVK